MEKGTLSLDHALTNELLCPKRRILALIEPALHGPTAVVIRAMLPRYLSRAGLLESRELEIPTDLVSFFFLLRLSRRSLHPLLRRVR